MYLYWLFGLGLVICSGSRDRVRLRDIETLTFHQNSYTVARRSSSIPELSCIGGSASSFPDYHPRSVQCYNRGFDGRDVQWECKAELDKNVRFGNTFVSCEGYTHPNDEYVLVGSCGLEFELEFMNGKKSASKVFSFKHPVQNWFPQSFSWFPFVIIILAVFAIWYFCLRDDITRQYVPVEPTAPPDHPPPTYDDTVRGGYVPPQPSASNYGWDIPPSRPTPHPKNYRTTEAPLTSSSWIQQGLAAGAGFLGGYLFGSSDRTRSVTTRTTSRNRLYPDMSEAEETYMRDRSPSSRYSHRHYVNSDSSDRNDRYVATTFAKTKRR